MLTSLFVESMISLKSSDLALRSGFLMAKTSREETLQIKVSPESKKEIRRCALDCDENLRTFVLKALRDRGVPIRISAILEKLDRR